MKKRSLAFVLAVVMILGCFAGLGAAGLDEETDFTALSVEEQYSALMSVESDEEAMALFATLDEEQQAALSAYAEAQTEASEPETYAVPAVNYTNVAPFVQQASPARARMLAKAASTSNVKTADGLILNKTATPVEGDMDKYKITLEAYTTGTVSTSETTKPTDIILVLDQSGSMEKNMTSYTYTAQYSLNQKSTYYVKVNDAYISVTWCNRCGAWTDGCRNNRWGHYEGKAYSPRTSASDSNSSHVQFYSRGNATTTQKLQALKDAVTSFTNAVAEKAKGADGIPGTKDDVNHRIAIVGFASGGWYNLSYYDYANTEVFIGSNQYKYGDSAKSVYSRAFQNLNTEAGKANVLASVGALDAGGGTLTNLGLEMANGIFGANAVADNSRNRVVVVFTDGEPGWSGYSSDVASSAISQANIAKNTYGATVYTVGIFDNADATSAGNQNGNNAQKSNWFMQNMSSNNGTVQDPSYYLSASDADTLSTIFQKISNQISESNINLGSDTQIKDVVSKYFDMPKNTSAVSVKSYDCTGFNGDEPTWSATGTVLNNAVTLDTENNTVNVTGFDFNANYVTVNGRSETDPKQPGDFHGRKLVIEFTVSTKVGFVGGNNVPTNGEDSGVYDKDGKLVANFVVPEVNVSITSSVGVNSKVIYEGSSVNVKDLYNEVDTSGADSWKYDFVKISYAVKQGNAAVGDTVTPADCTDYTVTATFAPISDGEGAQGVANDMAGKSVDGTATVHVLKPTVSAKAEDVTKYYGESYTPDGTNITGTVAWKDENHPSKTTTEPAPYTDKDLTYSYDWTGSLPTNIVPNKDTTVKVTYKVNGNDITDKVVGDKSYKVIAKTCTLTVNKSVAETYSDNDSFIFNVVGKGNVPYNAQVVITGNGSATLTGLPVGEYTVTEDTAWSWRYKSDNSKATTTLSSAKDNDSVTIKNSLDDNRWLGDETFVINKCEKSKITKIYESVMSFFGIV